MGVKRMIAAATLPTMLASPVIAASDNPATSLSLRGEDPARMDVDQSEPPQPVPIPPVEAAQTGGISTALLIGGAVVALVVIGAVVLGSKHHSSQPASA